MRPRLFETAQLELEQISVALQRAHGREPSIVAKPKRRLKLPAFSFGQILYVLGLLFLGGVLLHPWQKSVDPLGDAKLNNAPAEWIYPNIAVVDPHPVVSSSRGYCNRPDEPYRSCRPSCSRLADLLLGPAVQPPQLE